MSSTVSIVLKAEGVDGVKAALKGVKQTVIDNEAAATAAVRKGSKERLESWQVEEKAHEAMVRKMKAASAYQGLFGSGSGGSSALSGTRGFGGSGGGERESGIVKALFGDMGKVATAASMAGLAVGTFMAGIDLAANALKSFASFVLSDVVKPAMDLQTRGQQMSNAMGGGISGQEFQNRARSVALKNNFEAKDVMGAIDLFGDKQKGMDNIDMIATMSKSRGVPMQDLAALAAPLSSKMSTKDLASLLPSLAAQGKAAGAHGGASIQMGELAALGEAFIAPAQHLAGDENAQIRQMGGLMQTARKGFKQGARPTAGGVTSFLTEAVGSKALQAKFASDFSVDKATGATQIADVSKLIGDIMRNSKGGASASALQAMGLADGATKLLGGAYGETYKNAAAESKAAGGSEADAAKAGGQAVQDAISAVVTASGTLAQEEAGRAKVMETSGQKWDSAINEIKEKLLSVMPQVEAFVDEFASHSAEIVTAGEALAQGLLLLADGVMAGIEAFHAWSELWTVHAEGDVRKTVENKGVDTKLENMQVSGNWIDNGKGKLEYIQGSDDPVARAAETAQLARAHRSVMVNGQYVFQGSGAKKDSLFGEDAPTGADPGPPGAAKPTSQADKDKAEIEAANAKRGAAAPAADAHAIALNKSAASADKFATAMDKAASAADRLARNKTLLHGTDS